VCDFSTFAQPTQRPIEPTRCQSSFRFADSYVSFSRQHLYSCRTFRFHFVLRTIIDPCSLSLARAFLHRAVSLFEIAALNHLFHLPPFISELTRRVSTYVTLSFIQPVSHLYLSLTTHTPHRLISSATIYSQLKRARRQGLLRTCVARIRVQGHPMREARGDLHHVWQADGAQRQDQTQG
jgi:hypothetical protein